jgi:hypothetical protein
MSPDAQKAPKPLGPKVFSNRPKRQPREEQRSDRIVARGAPERQQTGATAHGSHSHSQA